jgi:UDP-3-O-[3-hydroxymyristoyl] glucosamine N-acyltransferase
MPDSRFHTVTAPKSLEKLAEVAQASLNDEKSAGIMIEDVAPLHEAGEKHISFFDNAKYKDDFKQTKAGACIVSPEMAQHAPSSCHLLLSKSPYKSYALIAQAFYPAPYPRPEISPKADIHASAKIGNGCTIESGAVIQEGAEIGDGCWIEAHSVIGAGVKIGRECRIGPHATISHSLIGDHTRLYPGVRVGQDGFGFAIDPAGHVKVPQLGRVIIGDHVEIGANSCIDRGAGPDTVIGNGTWIDNCVQIGHNVQIGKGCVIVAQAGIAGSTVLEDYVVVAAQGGVAGHLTIGSGTRIGAQAGVMRNLPAASEVMGSPSMPVREYWKQLAVLKKLTKRNKSE